MAGASRLALGTAQFGMAYGPSGRQVPLEEARAIVALARANGIDTIDTAAAYGDAEQRLAEIGTDGFRVVTKFMADVSEIESIQPYAVLMHRPAAAHYSALADLKARGLTQKIGISIYSPSELDALVPRFKFDLVQAPFNVENNELETSGWLSRLNDMGIEIHARSVFARGMLLDHVSVSDCLAFALERRGIDRVVVGVDSAAQLEEICQGLQ